MNGRSRMPTQICPEEESHAGFWKQHPPQAPEHSGTASAR